MKKKAALIYGEDDGHLDHLAPFCSLYDIPLYLTSKTLYEAAKKQYVNLSLFITSPNTISTKLIEEYDSLISTLPKQLLEPLFLLDEILYKKKLCTYWLPHGASDKKNMDVLIKEDHLLVYGKKMRAMLPEKARKRCRYIGNFRQKYYLLHKKFYENLLKERYKELFDKKNILYAPSWELPTIAKWVEALIKNKTEGINLYIKLHPNTYQSGLGISLKEKYASLKEVYFIDNFFPIYPILSKISYLYTDTSSIGYDFLSFNRPLFFTSNTNDPLHKCGKEIDLLDPYNHLNNDQYANKRAQLFNYTFSKSSEKIFS